jgi:hypothetical protein
MPEPDLVTVGDRCVIDVASIVAHLNTRGNFELVKIRLDNNVTLRSRSRLQQGVHCETGSMLMEKSLALTGETIEANTVWQGSPAARVFEYESMVASFDTRSLSSQCDVEAPMNGSTFTEYEESDEAAPLLDSEHVVC